MNASLDSLQIIDYLIMLEKHCIDNLNSFGYWVHYQKALLLPSSWITKGLKHNFKSGTRHFVGRLIICDTSYKLCLSKNWGSSNVLLFFFIYLLAMWLVFFNFHFCHWRSILKQENDFYGGRLQLINCLLEFFIHSVGIQLNLLVSLFSFSLC